MYRKGSQGWMKHRDFIFIDMVCLQIAFALSYLMRKGLNNPYADPVYLRMALVLVVTDFAVILFFETMKNVLKRGYYAEFNITVKHDLLVFLIATFYLFYIKEGQHYSRLSFLYMAVLYLAIGYPVRIAWKKHLKKQMAYGGKRSLLLVTGAKMVSEVLDTIKNHNYEMFHIAGIVVLDMDIIGQEINGIPVVANRSSMADYVCREWVDEVFFNLPSEEPYPEELINQLTEMGVTVHMKLVKSSNLTGEKKFVERLGNYTVLTTSINYATDRQLFAKRMLDVLGGIVGCLITLVLFMVLAPIIYIQSPGPIFFSQERVGKNGKRFKLYKFRSMYMDAEERKQELMKENRVKDGMMFKLDWDPRIIGAKQLSDGTEKKGIGNFIRDWSLDEFPQFFNVLKGDMSLVGTRPPTVDEWEKYDLHHRARLAIKPGITGMWQVSGRSNITDFEDVVKLDKKYIAEWNLGLDIKILLRTVFVVLRQEGAR
ncbi:MAG: sugar transferase [Brotaphodocola sp.]